MTELHLDIRGRTAHVALDRPHAKNALAPSLLEALVACCDELRNERDVHVVVLRGANGTFSAGADLVEFMPRLAGNDAHAIADLGRRAAFAIASLPQITIAAIEGYCVGGGVVLAGACDLRWAAPGTTFSIPELELGIPLAWGGLPRLIGLIGETMAAELVISCRRFDTDEAKRIGFVSSIFDGDLEARLAIVAARSANVLRKTKAQLTAIRAGTFDPKSDAKALLDALNDPESQRAAQDYIARRVGKKQG